MLRDLTIERFVCVWLLLGAAGVQGQSVTSDAAGEPTPASMKPAGPTSDSVVESLPQGLAPDDWASIRAAHEAGRHAAFAVDGGHRARNPSQQWATHFDGRGFTTTPDAGAWSWGLQLEAYGWGSAQYLAATSAAVSTDGQRVAYAWDERLTEWYVNDQRGLEHGFTVHARPESASGELKLDVAIRGGLRPAISADGRDVRFVDETGAAVLTYAGLTVFDARRQPLTAGWTIVGERLQLRVEDQDARYPVTIDPLVQQAYLKASNSQAGDYFGCSVAVWGDTVLVGASDEDSAATGVNGDQGDNTAFRAGAAYVFVRSGTAWTQQAYLKASNSEALDYFGQEVALFGDTAVVAAIAEDSAATGVNGDQGSNDALFAGAVYVFVRNGTTWTQQAYLKASNTQASDSFGDSVALCGDTLVVGAVGEDSAATGANGDQGDNSVSGSGAVYVFVRNGTVWTQQAYLKASNTGSSDKFGDAVAISADTVVVGAFQEGSDATGVNGDQGNNGASISGAAYVFVRNGTSWTQQAYLKASNTGPGDWFGSAVAISADTVVVGAPGEKSAATGVNGDQGSNSAFSAGAAYVFVRSGTTWTQQAYLKASNTEAHDSFGFPVAAWGDTVVVSAYHESSAASGVNGDQGSNALPGSGAAYVFGRNGTAWTQHAYVKASNTGYGDHFGRAIALWGDTLVVGALAEDSSATGVNGNQSNNSASDSGAAYVFTLPSSVTYCTAGLSTNGCAPAMSSAGWPSVAITSGFSINVANVEGGKQGLLFYGVSGRTATVWGSGGSSFQCVKAPTQRMTVQSSGGTSGQCDGMFSQDWLAFLATRPSALGQPFVAGTTVNAQAWYRDPPAVKSTNLSNALEFVTVP